MSAKVHLHMHVSDLAKSRDFYERFLGGEPVKVKQGYVKFLPEWAPVNLASPAGGHPARARSTTSASRSTRSRTVMAQLARVKAAGLPVTRGDGGQLLPRQPGQVLGARTRTASSGRSTT